jgi:hypothetical protein
LSNTGNVNLTQTANGGAGGNSGAGGTGGLGGHATSQLTFARGTGGTVTGTTNANGGAGGNSSGAGSAGSGGHATSSLTLSGSTTTTGTANATGGAGGTFGDLLGGRGGNATATAMITSPTAANATANATGGFGQGLNLRGAALATAQAQGASGAVGANADSGGGMFNILLTEAGGPTSGAVQARAHAAVSDGVEEIAMDATDAVGAESAAFAVGLPSPADYNAFFEGNSQARGAFNLTGMATSEVLALVTMGAGYAPGATGARTYSSSASFEIDLDLLTQERQDMVLAFLDPVASGAGFDSLMFQVSREGDLVINETFNTIAAATAFFDDQVEILGSNAVDMVQGTLSLEFELMLTTNDAGAGFAFDMLFGNTTLGIRPITADFDSDGDVDGNDFLTWQRGLGIGTTLAAGDADGNGAVDVADLQIWKDQFGTTPGGQVTGAVSAIPEPGAATVAMLGALALAARRRRA